ncbi:MAG TPA: DUF72 domain-containing protein [Verrucomicrobiae bacterium]|nr:DUF72 domain-containing protein [Verrucomicrobiae bacterium]
MKILVGTASWTDPGFIARWYPKSVRAADRLAWYSEHFNLVEINSSFYAVPARAQVKRWCEQTPDGFVFDVKLHRLLSRHSAGPETLPPDLRKLARVQNAKVQLTPELERALVKRILDELEPFRAEDKLGALLLQLSPSFSPRANKLADLAHLFECLDKAPLAVELRNRNWVTGDQQAETVAFFKQHKIPLVSVDSPPDRHFMIMPSEDYVTGNLAYLRCHGRNAEGYLKGKTVAARFNYLYNQQEVKELATRAVNMAAQARAVHVILNNNAEDYAPRNAADLRKVLQRDFPQIDTGAAPALKAPVLPGLN